MDAMLTALLFTIGKFAIGVYLEMSDIGSTYGAAGSLVIVLICVYYSAQILLFGAECTQVYANRLGARIVPSGSAMVADPNKVKGAEAGSPRPRVEDIGRHGAGVGAAPTPARSLASAMPFPWWVGVVVMACH